MPKISAVIPVYNAESYLRQCLDSVINQTLQDIEIIVVDDGSTDHSLEICKEYAELDNRIILIHQENQGLPGARNSGLNVAKGEWFIGIDCDDWCDSNYLKNLYHAVDEDVDVVIANCKRIIQRSDGVYLENRMAFQREFKTFQKEEIAKVQANTIAARVNICGASTDITGLRSVSCVWDKLYKMSIIKKHRLKFMKGTYREDIIFTSEYFHYVTCVKYIHNFGYNYRVRTDSQSHKFIDDLVQSDRLTLQELYRYLGRIPENEIKWKRIIEQAIYVAAVRFYVDELDRYFFSSGNKKPVKERLAELDNVLNQECYSIAFENVNGENLSDWEREFAELAKANKIQQIFKRWQKK